MENQVSKILDLLRENSVFIVEYSSSLEEFLERLDEKTLETMYKFLEEFFAETDNYNITFELYDDGDIELSDLMLIIGVDDYSLTPDDMNNFVHELYNLKNQIDEESKLSFVSIHWEYEDREYDDDYCYEDDYEDEYYEDEENH